MREIGMEGQFGRIEARRSDFCGAEQIIITTENYPECEQDCTMTRAQFETFVAKCREILKGWPRED